MCACFEAVLRLLHRHIQVKAAVFAVLIMIICSTSLEMLAGSDKDGRVACGYAKGDNRLALKKIFLWIKVVESTKPTQ
eukprot:9604-Heterococcus_DN1.PRE.8